MRTSPARLLARISLAVATVAVLTLVGAGRAVAEVAPEDDCCDPGGPDYSWSMAYDVSFVDFNDGWDFFDPSADIPSFSNVPPPPPIDNTASNPPPCQMSAVPGFPGDAPPLPMGHTYDIWEDGNLAGSYTCVPGEGGWAILWADGNNQNVTIVPLVW
jgi:hypothetical protein